MSEEFDMARHDATATVDPKVLERGSPASEGESTVEAIAAVQDEGTKTIQLPESVEQLITVGSPSVRDILEGEVFEVGKPGEKLGEVRGSDCRTFVVHVRDVEHCKSITESHRDGSEGVPDGVERRAVVAYVGDEAREADEVGNGLCEKCLGASFGLFLDTIKLPVLSDSLEATDAVAVARDDLVDEEGDVGLVVSSDLEVLLSAWQM
jgi:hypothetical protein